MRAKGGHGPPDFLQILHVMNSDFDTVHYCSKRVAHPHSSEIEDQAPPLCATVTFISKSRTARGLFVIASCQAEVEKAAAGGREIPSKHIQRETERESCREGQCPSTQILDSDLCRVRLLMVSGWQAAGPEEDDVAVGVAFPVSKDPRPLAQLAETSIAMPIANSQRPWMMDRSIDRRLCIYRLGTIHLCIYRCSCFSRIIRSVVRIKKDIRSMIRVS